MTLAANPTRVVYELDGATTVFPVSVDSLAIPYRIASHIKVQRLIFSNDNLPTVSDLVAGVNYALTGSLAPGETTIENGVVTITDGVVPDGALLALDEASARRALAPQLG